MATITAAIHAEATRQEIDQEIHKLQASIRDLQSRRNALSPSGRFPPEILSKIFLFCSHSGMLPRLAWINETTHICRHWRAVALECPSLWSSPEFSMPKWAEEMLKRSKMAPLTICASLMYSYSKPDKSKTFLPTLAQISRIRKLDVVTNQKDIISTILALTDPAPCLESLRLECTHASLPSEFSHPSVAFLNGETPRLRRLELTRVPISWDSPLMDNLVHLTIDHPTGIGSSVRGIVEALEKMPLLETLKLGNVLRDTQQGTSMTQGVFIIAASSTRVELKRLKRIHLAAIEPLECADILNHLSYPPTTMANIESTEPSLDTASLFALVQAHCDAQSPANFREIRSLSVQMTSTHLELHAWTSRAPSGGLPVTVPFLELNLTSFGLTQAVVEELLIFTCNALALRRLSILKFAALHEVKTKTWIMAFANLPMLETINVHGHADTFIAALQEDVHTDGVNQIPRAPNSKPSARQDNSQLDGVSGFLCFPSLMNLILERVDLEEPTLDNLETALMARCERQQKLRTLKLYDCSRITEEDVDTRLSTLVVEVDWDGIDLAFTEVSESTESDDDEYDYHYLD